MEFPSSDVFEKDTVVAKQEQVEIEPLSETSNRTVTFSSNGTLVNSTSISNGQEDCLRPPKDRTNETTKQPNSVRNQWLPRCRFAINTKIYKWLHQPKPNLTIRSLKRFPRGYPNFAAFLDSDESFMIYRRYGYLQSRIILEKQEQLRFLEEQLDSLDGQEMYDKPDNLFRRQDQGDLRKGILSRIESTFCEYANLLQAAQQLMTFNRPGTAEHTSLLNYVEGLNPVDDPESGYIYHKEDLITLRPGREHAWLDRFLEKLLRITHCRAIEWLFCTKETREKCLDEHQVYYDRSRINGCAAAIITLMILFMLIVPIYLEYHMIASNHGLINGRQTAICIGILLVFTLAFAAIMSFFTKAKRHEVLGAAAGYCAVLVVFLSNVGNSSRQ